MKKHQIKSYIRNDKKVYLDLIREIFVLATEEEEVRQDTLLSLLNNWKIPSEYIEVEESLSHYKKGLRGRADIIVKTPKRKPFILFEIKAPNVYIN